MTPRPCSRCWTYCPQGDSCLACGSHAFVHGVPRQDWMELTFPAYFGANGKAVGIVGPALHFDPLRRPAQRASLSGRRLGIA